MSQKKDASAEEEFDGSADAAFGGALVGSLDPLLMVESLFRSLTPGGVLQAGANLATQLPRVLFGLESADLPAKDSRFKDETFASNPVYNRVAGAYVTIERELMALVDNEDLDWRTRERARMVMGALTTAIAPTNTLPGNPQAIIQAFSSGGASLGRGLKNFVGDVFDNGGYPAQVDKSAFGVGENLAVTPGTVIHRTAHFELIHYTPVTEDVTGLPLLMLPPPVNKYYFWDLAPGRSLIEYAVSRGVDVFTIVWRDPREKDGDWGIDTYLSAAHEAMDVVLAVTEQESCHMFGNCSGGMLLAMLLAHQAATGGRKIASGTHGVTVLDFGQPGGIGVTASERALQRVRKRASKREVIAGSEIASTFVWMRPNDLIWRYLIDQWLLGKQPPAFDIMFWNADSQGMPAQLAADMTEMSLGNKLITAGEMHALGAALDLSEINVPTYHIAGLTDHISPWHGCYGGAQAMGGERTFVLTPTGHVQSLIYPMGKARAAFWSGPDITIGPEDWLEQAERAEDSWWSHWVDWLLKQDGSTRPASAEPGNDDYPALMPAPGSYVLGE